MPDDDKPIRHVTKVELRCMFNEQYWERIQRGEFREIITWQNHPCPESAHQPFCTWSQMVLYRDRDTGDDIISAHRYLLPDHTIGGFGRPDPKWIVEGGMIYKAEVRIAVN